jgi:hypothetical protein
VKPQPIGKPVKGLVISICHTLRSGMAEDHTKGRVAASAEESLVVGAEDDRMSDAILAVAARRVKRKAKPA